MMKQTYQSFEIVVVDGRSTDETLDVVKRYPIRLFFEEVGTRGGACNVGAKEARGDVVVFIDADCVAPPTWLEKLLRNFSDSQVAVVGGPDFTHPSDSVLAKAIGVGIERGSRGVIRGCNSAYRRDVFLSLGGFDQSLRYNEETELHKRIEKSGYKLVYDREAFVYHHRRSSLSKYFKQCYLAAKESVPLWRRHGIDRSFYRFVALLTGFSLFVFSVVAALVGFLPLFAPATLAAAFCLYAIRVPRGVAWLLLPMVYFVNYVASIVGVFRAILAR